MHKKLFYSPYGDYITILNVYNAWKRHPCQKLKNKIALTVKNL
jgi:hypothetical protein